MNDIPRLRLLISYTGDLSQLDNDGALEVELALRSATLEIVAPTLITGWDANQVPLLRLPGSPASYVELLPGTPDWTFAKRVEYMRQQARLIDATYDVAATSTNFCEMCSATKHCDSTCKNIVESSGEPVTVSVTYEGQVYQANLVFEFEWYSDPSAGSGGSAGSAGSMAS
jgi:hypothetical protein